MATPGGAGAEGDAAVVLQVGLEVALGVLGVHTGLSLDRRDGSAERQAPAFKLSHGVCVFACISSGNP